MNQAKDLPPEEMRTPAAPAPLQTRTAAAVVGRGPLGKGIKGEPLATDQGAEGQRKEYAKILGIDPGEIDVNDAEKLDRQAQQLADMATPKAQDDPERFRLLVAAGHMSLMAEEARRRGAGRPAGETVPASVTRAPEVAAPVASVPNGPIPEHELKVGDQIRVKPPFSMGEKDLVGEVVDVNQKRRLAQLRSADDGEIYTISTTGPMFREATPGKAPVPSVPAEAAATATPARVRTPFDAAAIHEQLTKSETTRESEAILRNIRGNRLKQVADKAGIIPAEGESDKLLRGRIITRTVGRAKQAAAAPAIRGVRAGGVEQPIHRMNDQALRREIAGAIADAGDEQIDLKDLKRPELVDIVSHMRPVVNPRLKSQEARLRIEHVRSLRKPTAVPTPAPTRATGPAPISMIPARARPGAFDVAKVAQEEHYALTPREVKNLQDRVNAGEPLDRVGDDLITEGRSRFDKLMATPEGQEFVKTGTKSKAFDAELEQARLRIELGDRMNRAHASQQAMASAEAAVPPAAPVEPVRLPGESTPPLPGEELGNALTPSEPAAAGNAGAGNLLPGPMAPFGAKDRAFFNNQTPSKQASIRSRVAALKNQGLTDKQAWRQALAEEREEMRASRRAEAKLNKLTKKRVHHPRPWRSGLLYGFPNGFPGHGLSGLRGFKAPKLPTAAKPVVRRGKAKGVEKRATTLPRTLRRGEGLTLPNGRGGQLNEKPITSTPIPYPTSPVRAPASGTGPTPNPIGAAARVIGGGTAALPGRGTPGQIGRRAGTTARSAKLEGMLDTFDYGNPSSIAARLNSADISAKDINDLATRAGVAPSLIGLRGEARRNALATALAGQYGGHAAPAALGAVRKVTVARGASVPSAGGSSAAEQAALLAQLQSAENALAQAEQRLAQLRAQGGGGQMPGLLSGDRMAQAQVRAAQRRVAQLQGQAGVGAAAREHLGTSAVPGAEAGGLPHGATGNVPAQTAARGLASQLPSSATGGRPIVTRGAASSAGGHAAPHISGPSANNGTGAGAGAPASVEHGVAAGKTTGGPAKLPSQRKSRGAYKSAKHGSSKGGGGSGRGAAQPEAQPHHGGGGQPRLIQVHAAQGGGGKAAAPARGSGGGGMGAPEVPVSSGGGGVGFLSAAQVQATLAGLTTPADRLAYLQGLQGLTPEGLRALASEIGVKVTADMAPAQIEQLIANAKF
jgi:hypothetical protein